MARRSLRGPHHPAQPLRRLILLLALAGCSPPAPVAAPEPNPQPTPEPEPTPEPSAVTRLSADGAGGPQDDARAGDYALTSPGGARFVVSDLPHANPAHRSGGNLVEVAVDGTSAGFGGLSTWFARVYPRQAVYSAIEAGTASVTVRGLDDGDASLAVETTWALDEAPAGALGALRITTTVTNTGAEPVLQHALGDIVSWGRPRHFAPGPGYGLRGELGALPWLGAQGPELALLFVGDGPLEGPHGSSWSDPVWATVDLLPGASASFDRRLLVGRSLGELSTAAWAILGEPTGGIAVSVTDVDGEPQAATVELRRGSEVWFTGRTAADGKLEARIPPGRYDVTAQRPGRGVHAAGSVDVAVDAVAEAAVVMTRAGRLRLQISDATGALITARFTLEGVDVPDPDFGDPSHAVASNRAYVQGNTELPLAPGRYRVTATRGPAWSISSQEVQVGAVEPGEAPSELRASLHPVLDLAGWRQCDLHTHSAWSPDSAVPPADALLATAGEGLDCFASTDHDATADWSDALRSTGLTEQLLWIPGLEVTSEEQAGHINAFPWPTDLGPLDHKGLDSGQILTALRSRNPGAIRQLNHPLWSDIGTWAAVGLDPATGLMRTVDDAGQPTGASYDYEAVEVLNGKGLETNEKVLAAWLTHIDAGQVATATANSDSHRLVGQERGSARTWIPVADGSQAAVVEALKAGRGVVASNGPRVQLTLRPLDRDRVQVAVRVEAPDWLPLDRVELHGGDPLRVGSWRLKTLRAGDVGLVESVEDGLRTWQVSTDLPVEGVDGFVVAVVRGEEDMLPWLDVPAFAVTNPAFLD